MDIGTTYKTWSMCSILQWLVLSSSIINTVIKTFWFVWRLISTPVIWSSSCVEGLSFTSTLSPVGTRSRPIVLEFKVFQCTERAVRLVHAILPPALVCDHAFYYNRIPATKGCIEISILHKWSVFASPYSPFVMCRRFLANTPWNGYSFYEYSSTPQWALCFLCSFWWNQFYYWHGIRLIKTCDKWQMYPDVFWFLETQ